MKDFFTKLPQKIEKFRKKHPIPKKARKPLMLLTLLVWTAAASIGSQYLIAYGMLTICGRAFTASTPGIVIYQVISYLLTLALVFFIPLKFSKKARTTREEAGLTGLPTWTDIGLAPLAFVASVLLGMALATLFSLFPWFDANQAQDIGFSYFATGGERILMFVAVVIVAPIAEELVFRGWLYGKIRSRFSMPIAILLVSALFGAVHLQWNVAINVFSVSVVLCILRELTGTIYSGIIVHMIKNGVAFFLVYILGIS